MKTEINGRIFIRIFINYVQMNGTTDPLYTLDLSYTRTQGMEIEGKGLLHSNRSFPSYIVHCFCSSVTLGLNWKWVCTQRHRVVRAGPSSARQHQINHWVLLQRSQGAAAFSINLVPQQQTQFFKVMPFSNLAISAQWPFTNSKKWSELQIKLSRQGSFKLPYIFLKHIINYYSLLVGSIYLLAWVSASPGLRPAWARRQRTRYAPAAEIHNLNEGHHLTDTAFVNSV